MLQRVCKECLSELDWTYGRDFFGGYEQAFCLECDEKRSEWFVWDAHKNRIIDEGQQEPEWLAEKQPWEAQSSHYKHYLTNGAGTLGNPGYTVGERNQILLRLIAKEDKGDYE